MKNKDTAIRRRNSFRQFREVFFGRGAIVWISLFIVIMFAVLAVFAPLIAPYSPTSIDPLHAYAPMFTKGHFLGSDRYGRDVLSRLIYGARTSMTCSLLSSIWACIVGSALGILAGFYEGMTGKVITRLVDAQLSIPGLILSMTLAAILGQNIIAIAVVIGIGSIPGYVRMAYSSVLSLKENDFITASRLVGQRKLAIMARHLLPNCFAPLIVIFTMSLGQSIMIESSLAYLGVGLCEPTPAWGMMVSDGFHVLTTYPTLALLPGFCIMMIVVAFNVLGDGLRDALDPKLRGKL